LSKKKAILDSLHCLQQNSLRLSGSYAATDSFHFTEPQVLHGGKVSVLDKGILAFSCLSLQKCSHNPDSGHFSPVR
jgi:hypothetical protein